MNPALWLGLTGPVVALIAYVAALVLHHRGRSPRGALAVVAAGLGLMIGSGLVAGVGLIANVPNLGLQGALVTIVPLVAIPAIVITLARSGARRAAGAFLAAGALPWLVVWGGFVVELLGGRSGQAFVIWTGAILGVLALIVGIALLLLPDPATDARSPDVQARRRKIGAFGAAFMDRARLGPVAPSVLAAIAAALIVSTDPTDTLDGLPAVGVAVAVAVIVGELELRLAPSRIRPALEAFHAIGRGEMERFKAIAGRTIPVTKGDAAKWLATPASEADLEYRSELLVWLDRRAEALAVVAQMPERTPMERLQKALEADFIAWSADGHERGIDFEALAAEVTDEAERLRADGLIAWRESQHRFAAGEPDWPAPLAAFRPRLGAAADGLHPRAMRAVVLIPAVGTALVLSALIQVLPG